MSVYEEMALCPKRAVRRLCADAFGVEEHRLVGASRMREIVVARHATCYVLRARFPEMSFPWLGRFMGGRDHSTIINAVRQTEWRMARDEELRLLIESLLRWPLPGQQPDSHVRLWRLWCAHMARIGALPRPEAPEPKLEPIYSELAEFADPRKVFCWQCDRSQTIDAAARCQARFCGLRSARQRAA